MPSHICSLPTHNDYETIYSALFLALKAGEMKRGGDSSVSGGKNKYHLKKQVHTAATQLN
jgi:hypothetical protein